MTANKRQLAITHDRFAIRGSFTISRGSRTHADVVTVSLSEGDATGRGECTPYARYGETVESVSEAINAIRPQLEHGLDREALQGLLPAGAARNAVDCALWDQDATQAGKPAYALAKLTAPQPVATAYTLSLNTPDAMAITAFENRNRPLLKVKLGGDGDPDRMRAVCGHAGDAKIIVDANEAWSSNVVWDWLDLAAELGIAMVEQPLPSGEDAVLAERPHPVTLCADESAHDRASLAKLVGLYDMVNIKLDKTGGRTEALAMKQAAKEAGFGVFIGCMMGSSLAMAPATLLTPDADFVDLDAPLLLADDRNLALCFVGSTLLPPPSALWG
ncbi:MAG: N-acetyl-D-Glu racemase DgcA [Cohaesibacteraceae bacterium]